MCSCPLTGAYDNARCSTMDALLSSPMSIFTVVVLQPVGGVVTRIRDILHVLSFWVVSLPEERTGRGQFCLYVG